MAAVPAKTGGTEPNDKQRIHRAGAFKFVAFSRKAPRGEVPYITLNRHKRIAVNGAACRIFGHHEAVEVCYDADRRTIGIKPATKETPEEFAFKTTTKGGTANWERYGFAISAGAFFERYRLIQDNSRRFHAKFIDDIVYLSLDEPILNAIQKGKTDQKPE